MEWIEVTGGRPLAGRIRPAAAKNSVLPLLAATLLCAQPCTLRGVPPLADVRASLALLEAVGAAVRFAGGCVYTAPRPVSGRVPPGPAAAMRGSVFYLAPLLVRAGRVELPLPGGCCLGPRPIDIHLDGLSAMGAHVETRPAAVALRRRGALHAVDYTLRLPSVGATLTLMMAAACAQGHSILRGRGLRTGDRRCRRLPQRGWGTDRRRGHAGAAHRRRGRAAPGGACRHAAAGPHRGRHLCGGCGLCGRLRDGRRLPAGAAGALPQLFVRRGCTVTAGAGDFTVARDRLRRCAAARRCARGPGPALRPDTAPLAAAVLLAAQGASTVHDSLFENRFACAAGFAALGGGNAGARARPGHPGRRGAARRGGHGARPARRRGAGHGGAGGRGRTLVADPGHIRRGYADLPGDLAALGARCRYLAPQEAEKIVEVP